MSDEAFKGQEPPVAREPFEAREFPHHFQPPDPADARDIPVGVSEQTGSLPRPPRPWYALIAGQWPLFVTLAIVAVGLAVTATGHWKRGTTVIGAAFALSAVLRLLLPERVVGLLHVRNKAIDTACLAVLGVGILVLALVVPPGR